MIDPSAPEIWLSTIGVLTVVGAAVWRVGRYALRGMRRIGHAIDDLIGEPARPGHPRKPGILERVTSIEHQFQPNDGKTLRDAVDRTEAKADAAALKAEEAVDVAKTANDLVTVAMTQFGEHLTRYHQRRDDIHERSED